MLPCNIEKLPSMESMRSQLNKLLKGEKGIESHLIRNFIDWAEAWAAIFVVVFFLDVFFLVIKFLCSFLR